MSIRIIACTNDERSEYEYFAYDNTSGGYPYWSGSVNSAYLFGIHKGDDELLNKEWNEIINGRDLEYSGGERRPNSMKSSLLGLCNAKPKGKGTLLILELKFEVQATEQLEGEILKPKGFIY